MHPSPQRIQLSHRTVDLVRYEVFHDGQIITLTRLEAKLLSYLAANAERVVSKDELLSKVWGYHSRVRSRAISNTANRLRPKIEDDPSNPKHLIVLYGRGLTLRNAELLSNEPDPTPPTQTPPTQTPAPTPTANVDVDVNTEDAGGSGMLPAGSSAGSSAGASAGSSVGSSVGPEGTAAESADSTDSTVITAPAILGRNETLSALRELLKQHRLVTLVGFGGIGKTRIAEQIAQDSGGHFVPLRSARTIANTAFEIARVLNIPLHEGDPVESTALLLRGLGNKLLVLDNVEQLSPETIEAMKHWLEAAPQVRLLLTSRRVLGLPGEATHRLRGLPVPEVDATLEALQENSAVQLFLRRARAVGDLALDESNRSPIIEIIRQLDGVPLALELVASRTALRSPQQLLTRLPELWSRQVSGHAPHHADLNEVVRWSWDLLGSAERITLAALSVFVGSFTLEAAESIVEPFLSDDDPAVDILLRKLADGSLLQILPGEPVRLSLYPPVHSFARSHRQEHWAPDDHRRLQVHHGEYYSQLGAPEFLSRLTSAGLDRCRQELLSDMENAQVAVRRAVERGDAELAMRCANGCAAAWAEQGPQSALLDLIPPILEMPGAVGSPAVQLRGTLAAALRGLARPDEARTWLEEGLKVVKAPSDRARLLMERGEVSSLAGQLDDAVADHRAALALMEEEDNQLGLAQAQTILAGVLQVQGECDEALDLLEDSLRVRRLKGDIRGQVVTLRCIAVTEWSLGNLQEANQHLERAVELARQLGDISRLTPTLMNFAVLQNELDHRETSRDLLIEVTGLCQRLGHPLHHSVTLINLADVCLDIGDLDAAWEHLEAGLAVADPEAWPRVTAFAHALAADIWLKRGRPRRARRRIRRAESICAQLHDPYVVGQVSITHARVLNQLGDPQAAADALESAEEQFNTACEGVILGRALVKLGSAWIELGQPDRARQLADETQKLLNLNRRDNARLNRELSTLRGQLDSLS